MPTDTEQLVVSLEARIRDFERNFQRANRTAGQNFKAIENQAKRSADSFWRGGLCVATRWTSGLLHRLRSQEGEFHAPLRCGRGGSQFPPPLGTRSRCAIRRER